MSGKTRQYLKKILKGALALGVGAAVVAGALSGANTNAMAAEGESDRDSGIVVNLHDYENTGWNNINEGHSLRFTSETEDDNLAWYNKWIRYEDRKVSQGIVRDKLSEDGYPTLAVGNGESLSYLFGTDNREAKNYSNVSGLLEQGDDGYWEYDSATNSAKLNTQTNTITRGSSTGYFFPFGQDNFFFGLDISAGFFMPEDRLVNGKDMIFEFSGDDDVWVFVDDVLVLDLGGIHGAAAGSINFTDGTVTYENGFRNEHATGEETRSLDDLFSSAGSTWNDDEYEYHTIKFYYLERGAGQSNCHIRFNLPTIPSDVIEIGKQVTNTNTADFVNAEFTMKVETADSEAGPYSTYVGPYALYDLSGNPIMENGQQVTGTTDEDGTFTLKHGQLARLTGTVRHEGDTEEHEILRTSYFKVTETGAYGYSDNYKFDLGDADLVDSTGTSVVGEIGKSVSLRVADHRRLVVRNRFTAANKYSVAITKQMSDGQTAPEGEKFSVKITDVNDNVVTGVQYRINEGDFQTISDDGIIQIASGDTITLLDVAYGAEFKIQEVGLDSATYKTPTYSVSEGDGTVASDGSYAIAKVELEDEDDTDASPEVTITNSLVNPPLPAPEINKRIGANPDGTYTLSLDVKGASNEQTITSTTPLDIVLVLDSSTSMNKNMSGGNYGKSKLEVLQEAVNAFIDNTAAANEKMSGESQHKVSVVTFSSERHSDSWWGGYATPYAEKLFGLTAPGLTAPSTVNAQILKSQVNGIDADGDTYPGAGLEMAEDILDGEASRDNAKKVVILFTDGNPAGYNTDEFDSEIAATAINKAKELKDSGTTVYTIGVFNGANPSDIQGQFNQYMNAVSSNFPQAISTEGWRDWTVSLGNRASSDYYKVANAADELAEIFDDIYENITTGSSYTAVSIIDELSQYARVAESVTWDESQTDDEGFYKVTSGVSMVVTDENDNSVNANAEGYPDVTFWYKPAPEGSSETTGTVKAVFDAGYSLRQDWVYDLRFDVRPTDVAYDEYEDSGYVKDPETDEVIVGDAGTDLYEKITSSGKEGFRSNHDAYVKYTANNKVQEDRYDHPVLQADSLTINGVLDITKTMNGHALDPEMFDFTVKPLETSTVSVDEATAKAGLELDNGFYTYSNAEAAKENEKQEIRTGATIRFTREDVGKTYAYEYAEVTTGLHQGYDNVSSEQVVFDQSKYKIELAVSEGKADDGTRTLKVTMSKYAWDANNESWSQIEDVAPVEITSANCDCSSSNPLMTIDFVNEMNPYLGLQIVKIDKATSGDENPKRLQGARFELRDSEGNPVQAYKGPDFTNDGNKVNGDDAVTDSNGILYFYGLEEDETYTLTETKFPSGYQAETEEGVSFTLRVNGGYVEYEKSDGVWERLKPAKVSGDPDDASSTEIEGCFYTQVANVKIPDLPSSGSSGAILVMSSGFAAIALGGAYLARKRMNPEA